MCSLVAGVSATSNQTAPLFPTIPEAARLSGISVRTLRAARDRGELRVYQLGDRWQRVYLPELIEYVQSNRVVATRHAEARVEELLERDPDRGQR